MNVLIILTSYTHQKDTKALQKNVINFTQEEFTTPYYLLHDAGASMTLCSPMGGLPPITSKSNESSSINSIRFRSDLAAQLALNSTLRLSDISTKDCMNYDALFFPGGRGALWDLADNIHSLRLVEQMIAAGKPVAAVGYGVSALCFAKTPRGSNLVKGKSMTGMSNADELDAGYIQPAPFHIEDVLVENGAFYSKDTSLSPFIIKDDLLITGQNPASSKLVTIELLHKTAPIRATRKTQLNTVDNPRNTSHIT